MKIYIAGKITGDPDYKAADLIESLTAQLAAEKSRSREFEEEAKINESLYKDAVAGMHLFVAEKNMAVEQMRGDCDYCKYSGTLRLELPCKRCTHFAAEQFIEGDFWKWRGVFEQVKKLVEPALENSETGNPENWNADPRSIIWEDFADECSEEAFPGVEPHCPACGEFCYDLDRCAICGQPFIEDEKTAAAKQPPKIEHRDCLMCGGKGAFEFTRSPLNGHKRGHCASCGASMIE